MSATTDKNIFLKMQHTIHVGKSKEELDITAKLQLEALNLIKTFCHRVPGCADFISNYVREVLMCTLDNFFKTGETLVDKL